MPNEPETSRHRRNVRIVAGVSFVWVFLSGCCWIASGAHNSPDGFYQELLWGFFVALPGFLAAIVTVLRIATRLRRGKPSSIGALLVSIATLGGGLLMDIVVWGLVLDRLYPSQFAHGRRLHRRGRILAPRSTAGRGWIAKDDRLDAIALPLALDLPAEERRDLAAQWRENGSKEHASIAAFAQLTLDLLSVGAPASLVLATQRATADEVRHAELCYAVARAIDGRDESPAPFPEAHTRRELSPVRSIALSRIAVDALADGALNEGIAARLLARLGTSSASPALRAILLAMAEDEARHARDSWDLVAWCLEEGGTVAHAALTQAGETMPDTLGSPLPVAARLGAWAGWGVQSVAMEVAEYRLVRRHAERRLAALLRSSRSREAA
jgi:hypothetical protein